MTMEQVYRQFQKAHTTEADIIEIFFDSLKDMSIKIADQEKMIIGLEKANKVVPKK